MIDYFGNIFDSVYGSYRTRTFTDIYPNVEDFIKDYTYNGIKTTITTDSITTLYYLLYARYGNSHIVNSDENQFKYRLFSTIFMYGPTWEKRLDVQNKLRGLTDKELIEGTKQINNHSYNPSTEPSTSDTEELPTTNEIEEDMLNKLVEKYKDIDNEIKLLISEIEYVPNDIDKERFIFTMNDGNYIYITLYKILSINEYIKILPNLENKKGILYLDSGNYFEILK